MATKQDDMALDVDQPDTPDGRASTDGQQTSSAEVQIDLKRGFKMRHVNMFAIAGSIGTGLIIGSGQALAAGGPGSILIAYCILGTCVYTVMTAFAEMAIFAPMNKGFSGYATRFVDPALGFATGWNYFFKYSVLLANNLTATGLIIKYWREDINVGVWIAVFGVFVMALNFLPVEKFGETEFVMAIVKIIVLVGLILGCFIISMGGSPSGDRIGFRYWNDPGAFAPYLEEGSLGRFLGFWACIVQAAFMFMGCEVVGITYGEAKNPQRAIPRAVQQTIWRIAVFYIGGVIVLGMTVPYTNELLLSANKAKTSAAASPFVVALRLAGIKTLPGIVNACFLMFTLSFANSDIYIASRTLYGLARDHQAPAIFAKTNRHGVPVYAILASSLFICLAFLNVSTSSSTVFGYFVSLSTVLGLINWVNIIVTYFCFQRGIKAQGITRAGLPWKGPLQPYSVYFTFVVTATIIIFSGYSAFIHGFKLAKFITSYLGIVVYLLNIFAFKVWRRTSRVKALDMDLVQGQRLYDEDVQEEKPNRNFVQKLTGALWGS
ncbi:hypothetical protein CEP51_004720 [Fusarium floridanum]|uniref:Amino acid permease/ SLC12A domain-containing protein n=1 Tax=Fusarium floridanum TaxID=1325733 RepID=A0A428S014_9HYPO|nr:hypothetical protein CEP51_004720 [Fusarium floridanum]